MEIYLRYVGSSFLPGVPARDLSREEADRHGVTWLLKSGLYARVPPGDGARVKSPEKPKASEDKSRRGGYENKGE